jgi:FKBP-type peptidyl-prolyl cis-trans isomerase FkpA
MKKTLPFLLMLVLFVACTTDEARLNREIAEIENYIATTGLDFTETPSGLFYHVLDSGNVNRIPDSTNEVSFKHVGYLLDSTIFSNGWYASSHVSMPNLVQGFQKGLQIAGEGGTAVVVFPSTLGYGEKGASTVPEYSPLILRLKLVSYY